MGEITIYANRRWRYLLPFFRLHHRQFQSIFFRSLWARKEKVDQHFSLNCFCLEPNAQKNQRIEQHNGSFLREYCFLARMTASAFEPFF